ncbi:hypothetical protein ABQD87_09595 [Enterococcus gallinarum]
MGGEKKQAFAVKILDGISKRQTSRYCTYISFLYYINNWIGDKEK